MRRWFLQLTLLSAAVIAAGVLVLVGSSNQQRVNAQSTGQDGGLKASQIEGLYTPVSMDCLDVKFKLSKVHEEDALSRVQLGQSYESVSVKLMERLNGRVVENKLDGGDLIRAASEYEKAFVKFKDDYRQYESSMSALLKSDCQTQPQIFYVSLQRLRERRETVHFDTAILSSLISKYERAFKDFREATAKRQSGQASSQQTGVQQ